MKFTAPLFSCLMTASVFTACGDSDSSTTSSGSDKIVEKMGVWKVVPCDHDSLSFYTLQFHS